MTGFGQLVRAEWTKLRSVRRWQLGLAVGVILTVLVTALLAGAVSTNANDVPNYRDEFHFVHQSLTGDGSITARLASQAGSHEWAKAGVMLKAELTPGAPYAAMLVTPGHGSRFQANFDVDEPGTAGPAPRWLRLTRTGTTVTGFESVDGVSWSQIGQVDLAGLPETVAAGLFVTSPSVEGLDRQFGSVTVTAEPTLGSATFDQVNLEPGDPAAWEDQDVRPPAQTGIPDEQLAGSAEQDGDAFTVTGSGDVTRIQLGDDDVVRDSLRIVLFVVIAVVALAVLFVTSEYKHGMIRTTFAASPRRGRVLAAKATVVGAVAFLAGLVASIAAFLVAQPLLRGNGYEPPAYPYVSLADGPVLRAVVGTALLTALLAIFSLGLAVILRRSAGAITLVIVLVVLPQILLSGLPLAAIEFLGRATPVAGFAVQQTRMDRFDVVIGPWAGLGVLAAWAAASLALGYWRLRRRDA